MAGQPAPMGHLYQVLALIGAVNAAIAATYYLRVVGVMYLRGAFQPAVPFVLSPLIVAVVLCAVATLIFGIVPGPALELCRIGFAKP